MVAVSVRAAGAAAAVAMLMKSPRYLRALQKNDRHLEHQILHEPGPVCSAGGAVTSDLRPPRTSGTTTGANRHE